MSEPRAQPGPARGPLGPTDPEVERTLRRLELSVTRRLDGMLLGDHLGLLPGQGSEKAESRQYHVGDDVRRMDWSVTARTTVPHVHDLVADRELETWVVVDLSASLEFGTGTLEKRDLAVNAVAAVGFLTARTGNRMGAVVLTGAGRKVVPARAGRAGLRGLLRVLVTAPRTARSGLAAAGGGGAATPGTSLAEAIESLRRPPRRRGLTVVVSDFLPVGDMSWERPLRALGGRHQTLAVEVVDPLELELPNVGWLDLVDAETGRRVEVRTSAKVRQRYAAAAAAHRRAVAAAVRRAGAGHLVLRTDSDWMADVVRYVSATRRRGAASARPVTTAAAPGTRTAVFGGNPR